MHEPINTTALALVYMLEGFAEKVLDRYEKAKERNIIMRDGWILSMSISEVCNLDKEEKDGDVQEKDGDVQENVQTTQG